MFAIESIKHLREVLRTAGELHIVGPPASGKTALARAVAKATGLPVVAPQFSGPGRATELAIAASVEAQQGARFVHLLDHGEPTEGGVLAYPGVGPRVPGELRIVVTGQERESLAPTAGVAMSWNNESQSPSTGPLWAVVGGPGGVIRTPTEFPRLITPDQLAEMLSVSTKTLDRWRRGGSGPACIQVGGSVRYRAADVEDWLSANRCDPAV